MNAATNREARISRLETEMAELKNFSAAIDNDLRRVRAELAAAAEQLDDANKILTSMGVPAKPSLVSGAAPRHARWQGVRQRSCSDDAVDAQ